MNNNALIGNTGFVGSTLLKQQSFHHLYRSTNIQEIENGTFDTVICAGAPAQKWIANKDPAEDEKKITGLINHLRTIKCKKFILISTVDVFKSPECVNEDTVIDTAGLHPYGLNRYKLENFVRTNFEDHLIIRLPGLVGPGIRKNIIFDFLNNNNIETIDSRNIFQFYPMVNLSDDIKIALDNKLNLVHLTAEPISVQCIAEKGFNLKFTNKCSKNLVSYDMQSCHSHLFGGSKKYQYSAKDTLLAVRYYAQSETKKIESL